MTRTPQYALKTAARDGLVRDLPAGHEDQRGVSNSATLIWDGDDAILVDTLLTVDENARLIEWIREQGKSLVAVYVTHGHGDHAFGIGQLRDAFPQTRFWATAGTIAQLRLQASPTMYKGFWQRLFPAQIPPVSLPEVLDATSFSFAGHEARVIETGFTDSPQTTVLWIPDAGLLVGGDVVYNNTYPHLSSGTDQTRRSWIDALTRLKALHPTHVVSAHKDARLGDPPSDIDATIQYLHDVADVERTAADALDFYRQMLIRQPGRRNIGSLWGAATAIFPGTSDPAPLPPERSIPQH